MGVREKNKKQKRENEKVKWESRKIKRWKTERRKKKLRVKENVLVSLGQRSK